MQQWNSTRAANIISTIPCSAAIWQTDEMVKVLIFPRVPLLPSLHRSLCFAIATLYVILFTYFIWHVLAWALFTFVWACLIMKLLAQGESVLPNDSLINSGHHPYQRTLQKQLTFRARYATLHECWSEGSIVANRSLAYAYVPTQCPSKCVRKLWPANCTCPLDARRLSARCISQTSDFDIIRLFRNTVKGNVVLALY